MRDIIQLHHYVGKKLTYAIGALIKEIFVIVIDFFNKLIKEIFVIVIVYEKRKK